MGRGTEPGAAKPHAGGQAYAPGTGTERILEAANNWNYGSIPRRRTECAPQKP